LYDQCRVRFPDVSSHDPSGELVVTPGVFEHDKVMGPTRRGAAVVVVVGGCVVVVGDAVVKSQLEVALILPAAFVA
jgi:hypothetical protein